MAVPSKCRRRRVSILEGVVIDVFQTTKPAIILMHGFWGGAAHWAKVIVDLSRKGHSSLQAVDMPLASLAGDAERTRKMIAQQAGPVLLVGHSYGGASPKRVTSPM